MFVLDTSVTMAWCFKDEQSSYTESVLRSLENTHCLVPLLWIGEVTNILQVGLRRQRITELEIQDFCTMLDKLPIKIDGTQHKFMELFSLSQEVHLTAYDAQYLLLAQTHQIALATLDKDLKKAATLQNISIYNL